MGVELLDFIFPLMLDNILIIVLYIKNLKIYENSAKLNIILIK